MVKIKHLAAFLLFVTFILSNLSTKAQENDSLKQSVSEINKALEVLKRLKVTGWVQAQFQWAESKGADNFEGGAFGSYSDKRFMIRRGRVKFTYTQKLSQFVLQINGTERGLNLVEIYAKVTEPWSKSFSLVAGVMNRPFGFEIEQSSSVRETPERSRYTQTLMPNERDLGAKIIYEPLKSSPLYGLDLMQDFIMDRALLFLALLQQLDLLLMMVSMNLILLKTLLVDYRITKTRKTKWLDMALGFRITMGVL